MFDGLQGFGGFGFDPQQMMRRPFGQQQIQPGMPGQMPGQMQQIQQNPMMGGGGGVALRQRQMQNPGGLQVSPILQQLQRRGGTNPGGMYGRF